MARTDIIYSLEEQAAYCKGHKEAYSKAEQTGYDRGYDEGWNAGFDEGFEEANKRARALLDETKELLI
jgi:flagellar biosynthesis/type III secretory pathway protein FliH